MKIELVNDRQIRCTLTKADLADRELKLSELAYGTEKAKNLFRDMIQQASLKFGFEAEDIPLMIEAIPLNSECIVLIITKVEDPEELDTRFSRFVPSVMDEEQDSDSAEDEILDLFNKIKQEAVNLINGESSESIEKNAKSSSEGKTGKNTCRIFSFGSLYEIITPAKTISKFFDGKNTLYKDKESSKYLLALNRHEDDTDEQNENFNKACNVLSEYGKLEHFSSAGESFFSEHYEIVMQDNAIQKISMIE